MIGVCSLSLAASRKTAASTTGGLTHLDFGGIAHQIVLSMFHMLSHPSARTRGARYRTPITDQELASMSARSLYGLGLTHEIAVKCEDLLVKGLRNTEGPA